MSGQISKTIYVSFDKNVKGYYTVCHEFSYSNWSAIINMLSTLGEMQTLYVWNQNDWYISITNEGTVLYVDDRHRITDVDKKGYKHIWEFLLGEPSKFQPLKRCKNQRVTQFVERNFDEYKSDYYYKLEKLGIKNTKQLKNFIDCAYGMFGYTRYWEGDYPVIHFMNQGEYYKKIES